MDELEELLEDVLEDELDEVLPLLVWQTSPFIVGISFPSPVP